MHNLQVVWFKRDLRTEDHEALSRAGHLGPLLCCYVIENDYWQLSDTSNRQWQFVRESLQDLSRQLESHGGRLVVVNSSAVTALEQIRLECGQFTLHSHEETGNLWTYERDRAVARWCKSAQITWHEYSQFGVVRPVSTRNTAFKEYWNEWVSKSLHTLPANLRFAALNPSFGLQPTQWPRDIVSDDYNCPKRQLGGRARGLSLLRSFLNSRSERYRGSISSPLTAETGCSRLSPYLAYGCLSLREIAHSVRLTQTQTRSEFWKKSLNDYRARLMWHCSFIQAFECSHQMEYNAIVPVMEQLERPFDAARFEAWKSGRTGWPLVDACMRYLHTHGWINFRMRAMLVSVATFTLSLPWRPVAEWLAKQFVDFEPGIHYSQIQMQSGLSHNQILRIYNPVTQATSLDKDGVFVRRWVPELRMVSHAWLFEPWKMPKNVRAQVGWTAENEYPAPFVDFEAAHRQAKLEVTELRSKAKIRRKPSSATKSSAEPKKSPQLSLF